ncbi:MAG: hypothetical protein JWO54_499, partial [Candidatus Saccharibacteria bacterium]|nr:hypothetical protein [Candidatus Saccharibacteria bacterium]
MTTGNNEQQPKQKRYVVVDSGFKTYGEYLADKQMREQQALQQQQMAAQGYVFDPRVQQYVPQYDPRYNPYPQHPPQAAYGQQPHPQQYGPRPPHWPVAVSGETAVATIPHPPEKKPRWQPSKRIKVIAGIAVGLVVFGGGTGVAYDTNLGNFQSFVEPINPFDDDSTAGYDSTELKTLSTSSLSHDHCDDADAVILTAYVSGYMPAAPLLPTTENATPTKIPPYLEKEDFPDGPKDPSELKEGEIDPANFVTDSGYPEFYMVDMPLGL